MKNIAMAMIVSLAGCASLPAWNDNPHFTEAVQLKLLADRCGENTLVQAEKQILLGIADTGMNSAAARQMVENKFTYRRGQIIRDARTRAYCGG